MSESALKVLFVTSEVAPFSKVGGLADISAALPQALARLGCKVRVVTPRYGMIDRQGHGLVVDESLPQIALDAGGRPLRAAFLRPGGRRGDVQVLFVDCEPLYGRPGIYLDPFSNRDYLDNDYRFILLCRAALALCSVRGWVPDIVHCNDWPAGLVPLYLQLARARGKWRRPRSLLTIHNIAYHGLFDASAITRIGGADRFFYPGGPLEFYGQVSFLKAGLELADGLNTVSPTYAREIQSSYEYGFGLETVLRARGTALTGVLNGIDTDTWNPAADAHIAAPYGVETLEAKELNKRALCAEQGFVYDESVPVIGIISRIVTQKGFEILIPVLSDILGLPSHMVILGRGDAHFEHVFHEMARIFPDRFRVCVGHDEALAHRIEAGADMFLMPSKYEPCGLNQMMSMRYGTLPIVRATGGLADTVRDADHDGAHGTGFTFAEYKPEDLLHAIQRATTAFRDRARWRSLQRNAMSADFSWERSARQYVELYQWCLESPPRVV